MRPRPVRSLPRDKSLGVPSERVEMQKLAEYLDLVCGRYGWLHVPNEGKRSQRAGASLKAQGLKPGAPDVLIFKTSPCTRAAIMGGFVDGVICRETPFGPALGGTRGVAIELKRRGATDSAITADQIKFGAVLAAHAWYWFAAAGADAAIDELARIGFGGR